MEFTELFTAILAVQLTPAPCITRLSDNKKFLFRKQCENECSEPGSFCRKIDAGAFKWECVDIDRGQGSRNKDLQKPLKDAGCADCDAEKIFSCPRKKRKWVKDKPVPYPYPNRALLSIPNGFIVRKSGLPNAGLGVWTLKNITECAIIGPYGGVKLTDRSKSTLEYAWKIEDAMGEMHYLVDGVDPSTSNWLRYINSAMTEDNVNLNAVQYRGAMYYEAKGPIPAGTELLVWYGDDYARWLGLL